MKRYPHSAIILLAALSLAGCSKTEEFQYNPDSALQIESVSGISPFALMQEPASKAVISGETLPGDEAAKGIGLFVTASNGSAYDGKTEGYSNIRYTYNGTKWSATSPIYLSNTTGKLYGYFPYNADATDLTAIPVASSLNGTDYLYATSQDVSFSNKSVNLQMNHALARLHLTIKKGDKYLSDCSLTKIVLQSKAIDANGTMDITTGAVSATKAADATGTFTLTGTDAVTKTGIEKDILLVPADNSEGKKDITLTLTIDGVDAVVNFKEDNGLDIRSGIQCNATLTIEDTGIKVTGVGVGVWNDGGSQSVEVGGHKVTVRLSEEVGFANDALVDIRTDGSSVTIKALTALTGRFTQCTCTPAGKATCNPLIDATTGICTFTITDVQDDITAEVGYLKYNATVEYDSDMGSVKLNGVAVASGTPVQIFYGEEVKFLAEAKSGCGFVKWTDGNDNDLSTDNPYTVSSVTSDITLKAIFGYEIAAEVTPVGAGTVMGAGIYAKGSTATLTATAGGSGVEFVGWAKAESPGTIISTNNPYKFTVSQSASYVAVFRLNDALSGVFTVAADEQGNPKKKVQFSKGNLWYGKAGDAGEATFNFEANQYDTTPSSSDARVDNHISHFMWCDNATNAMTLKYDDEWKKDETFFAGKNFTVNGYSGWGVLTGGANGEWTYLLEIRTGNRFAKAKINGMSGLLIFPDGYSLPSGYSSAGGAGMSKVNDKSAGFPSENIPDDGDNKIWPEMEADGVVFLPAASYRDGSNGSTSVSNVGHDGYYWSASSYGVNLAYDLLFISGSVGPSSGDARYRAQSVRLVTECR